MNKKRSRLLLLVVLLLAIVVLSGCAPTQGAIDLHKPNGIWETVVYDVALALQWLNGLIQKINIPFIYDNSWGWAIIIFTLAIKLVTLPLTLKQLQSTKATQELQPKLAELQQKYGKDKQKLQEEQMKLYKEAGVNPLGGCLPLVIQMPILFALYQAMYALANPSVGSLKGRRFSGCRTWLFPALQTGEKVLEIGKYACNGTAVAWRGVQDRRHRDVGVVRKPATHHDLDPVDPPEDVHADADERLARRQQATEQRMMGQMMLFMPVFFGYITLGLPSGLSLYWTVSNILSIVQQYFITGWGSLVAWLPMLGPQA